MMTTKMRICKTTRPNLFTSKSCAKSTRWKKAFSPLTVIMFSNMTKDYTAKSLTTPLMPFPFSISSFLKCTKNSLATVLEATPVKVKTTRTFSCKSDLSTCAKSTAFVN